MSIQCFISVCSVGSNESFRILFLKSVIKVQKLFPLDAQCFSCTTQSQPPSLSSLLGVTLFALLMPTQSSQHNETGQDALLTLSYLTIQTIPFYSLPVNRDRLATDLSRCYPKSDGWSLLLRQSIVILHSQCSTCCRTLLPVYGRSSKYFTWCPKCLNLIFSLRLSSVTSWILWRKIAVTCIVFTDIWVLLYILRFIAYCILHVFSYRLKPSPKFYTYSIYFDPGPPFNFSIECIAVSYVEGCATAVTNSSSMHKCCGRYDNDSQNSCLWICPHTIKLCIQQWKKHWHMKWYQIYQLGKIRYLTSNYLMS